MKNRGSFLTEQRLPESAGLDAMSTEQVLRVLNEQDARAVAAVEAARPTIARAVDLVVEGLREGGRLIYVGAGTSGGLAVLDAAEVPVTYGCDPEQVQAIFAGGLNTNGQFADVAAEDSIEAGAAAIEERAVGASDIVMGIAAGGTTGFVHGALRAAQRRGAKSVFLCCVEPFPGEPEADVTIRLLTGPEVVTGSTRLKAGTATKLVLNAITTTAMVRLGKVYDNLLVEITALGCTKAWDRGARIVAAVTGIDYDAAVELTRRTNGRLKHAILMQLNGLDIAQADRLLAEHNGNLRAAMGGPRVAQRAID
jgi:N-acetylmuramic acid 6-phosphate etherase